MGMWEVRVLDKNESVIYLTPSTTYQVVLGRYRTAPARERLSHVPSALRRARCFGMVQGQIWRSIIPWFLVFCEQCASLENLSISATAALAPEQPQFARKHCTVYPR